MKIISIRKNPAYLSRAVDYCASKWNIDQQIYAESMTDCIQTEGPTPRWFMMLDRGRIVGSYGLIENDFMVRKDLTPWLCALYVEEDLRNRGLGAALLKHARREAGKLKFSAVYLCTDHIGYYEKHGFTYRGNEESEFGGMTRVYEADSIF